MRLLSVLLVLCLLVACAAQIVPPAAEPDPVPVQPPAPVPTLKPVPAPTPEPTAAPTLPNNGTGYCQSQVRAHTIRCNNDSYKHMQRLLNTRIDCALCYISAQMPWCSLLLLLFCTADY
jgi:hypothetical protein